MDPTVTENPDSRTERLLGREALETLRSAHVLVVGLGGVGGYAAEMLVRTGVGSLCIVDADTVAPSNLNRQLIALRSTIGYPKASLFRDRFSDIIPDAKIDARQEFLTPDNIADFLTPRPDFIIDAIDTVAPKTALIVEALRLKIPIISSMGAGGRTDPSQIVYSDIWKTRDDGLAKAVRQRLKKVGIKSRLHVVCSTEPPHKASLIEEERTNKRTSFGTIASIPSIFGIFLANHVIMNLIKKPHTEQC